jgi:acetolactate synthase-1/2/3 large subunit
MDGSQLMAKAIERQGVKTVFGLPGHLEYFFGALQDQGIRLIHMRHEAAVVTAADGYARTRRGIGIACVTAGPGLANAVGGLVTAYEACTPLLLITGRNPMFLNDTGALQDMDHPRLVRSITKWAATVYDASRLGEYIDMACRIALSGRPGPVLLEVPRDAAHDQVNEAIAAHSLKPLVRAARPLAAAEDIVRAADVLMQAERPVVIAGNGAYWGQAGAGLRRLAGEFQLPVFGRALGRGLVPEDSVIGFSWPQAHPAVREADVVLLAGLRLGSVVSYGAPPFFREDARFIQINIDGAEIGRDRFIEAPVVGDCGPAVEAIAVELAQRRYAPRDCTWVKHALRGREAKFDETGREEGGMVHPLRMARELAKRMPDDAIFIGDGANCLNWYKGVLQVRASPGWMDHDPFGSMGVGLPLAIGAAAAQQETTSPRPVFLGTGDGAFGQYLGELASASLHGLPIFIMLANDGCWGASRNIEMRLIGRTYGVELNQSRYDLVAQGLECHGELAATPADVGPAFDRALAAVRGGTPALVNVLVDCKVGEQRADPQLQTMPFNHEWFAARSKQSKR